MYSERFRFYVILKWVPVFLQGLLRLLLLVTFNRSYSLPGNGSSSNTGSTIVVATRTLSADWGRRGGKCRQVLTIYPDPPQRRQRLFCLRLVISSFETYLAWRLTFAVELGVTKLTRVSCQSIVSESTWGLGCGGGMNGVLYRKEIRLWASWIRITS